MSIFRAIFQWMGRNPTATQAILRTLPIVVSEVDRWISTASYNQAQDNIRQIQEYDQTKLVEIYRMRKQDMGPDVRRAFEDHLRKQGKLP
jgi:hypothetical protein